MRTHGWSGSAPATDDEAVARILAAAGEAIDERGADVSIADVARTLGVTRQTVYRYFPSTDALLVASAVHAAADFLDRLADHLQRCHRSRGRRDRGHRHRAGVATAGQAHRAARRARPGHRAHRVGDVGRRAEVRQRDAASVRRRLGGAGVSATQTSTNSPSTCCGSSSRSSSIRAAHRARARICGSICDGGWAAPFCRPAGSTNGS